MSKVMSYFLMGLLMKGHERFSVKKLRKQEGQTWMEYGMIAGGIILIIVLVISLFGDKMMGLFTSITNAIGIRNPSGGGNGGW